eukprot:TRINITY_DN25943_c0_g1_i1.p1 TRINITY_DN25943_c0_g1~~TRINITY_DN25943_c0_g1_i1.p1  ORF type:complete len:221 (+),score=44.57 TRINITY_DN25943_c0_g1_i1:136-798(+)
MLRSLVGSEMCIRDSINAEYGERRQHTHLKQGMDLTGMVKKALGYDPKDTSLDVYRDTPVRYMGYCNEVGEAFRPLVPVSFVYATYAGSMAYVCADSYDKAQKAREASTDPELASTCAQVAAADCFVWQTLASVAIPGWTIHKVVDLTKAAVLKGAMPKTVVTAAPTVVGLGMIPLIIHPIDYAVEVGMDNTIRPFYKKYLGSSCEECSDPAKPAGSEKP